MPLLLTRLRAARCRLKGKWIMKTRLFVVVLICGSLLAGAANAQKVPIRRFLLQDDETGSHFTLYSDGSYAYAGCGNEIRLEGVGNIRISGCMVTFEAVQRLRLVQAEVDLCKRTGRASILLDGRLGSETIQVTVIDSDMSNNTTECK